MPKTDYELTINDKQVEKSLDDTQARFDKMGKAGDDAMKKVGKSGKSMGGVLTGAVGGAFTALTTAAVKFGTAAVAAFSNIIKSSVQAAAQFDITKKKFTTMFDGQEDQAIAVMDSIGKHALKIGLDMNEALALGAAFLPDVKGAEAPLEMLNKISSAVQGLALETPEQGVFGIRLGVEEALSGNLKSLVQRADLLGREVDIIKEAQKEYGETVGLFEGINQVLEARGIIMEDAGKSLAGATGKVGFAISKLQIESGKPVVEQMTESMNDLNKVLAENSDDLLLLAGTMGDLVATVLEFLGTNITEFLEDFDVSGLNDAAILLGDVVNEVLTLADLLFELEIGEGMFDDLNEFLGAIKEALGILNQVIAITKAVNESETNVLAAVFEARSKQTLANRRDAEDAGKSFSFFYAQVTKDAIESSEAATESFQKSFDKIEEGRDRAEKNAEARAARRASQDVDTETDLAEAEVFLKEGDAATETAKALAELGLAEKDLESIQEDVIKTQEKLVDAEEKSAQERLDIERDFQQERVDLAIRFSQERQDIERQSLLDIAAIQADHVRAVEDQSLQLNRSTRDMGIRHGQERSDAAKDLRRNLIDIEQNYQDDLRRIQRTAQQAMEEAERGLDAQAFIAALRQQEVAQEEAGVRRDQDVRDARSGSEERLDDLAQAQTEERAALQQSDQDKLQDLQIRLDRELEAQVLSDQLAFEQQAIDEQRRVEQQILSEERRMEQQVIDEQRRLDALIQGQAERLAKMVEGLDAETAAVVLAEINKLAAVEDFAGAAEALLDRLIANVEAKTTGDEPEDTPAGPPDSPPPGPPPLHLPIIQKKLGGKVLAGRRYRVGEVGIEGYIPHRGFGGDARIGQPTIVGEFGEELWVPPSSGTIIPNNQMGDFLGNTTNVQQSISNTQNNLGGFSVTQSMIEDPIQRSQLENFVLDIMSRN